MNNEMIKIRKMDIGDKLSPVLTWVNEIDKISLAPVRNREVLIKSAETARSLNCPLPLIISLCPAITNLETPNEKGQTRELIELPEDNLRLNEFISELFNLNSTSLNVLGVPIDTMLIFANVLEDGAGKMFTNVEHWNETALVSAKNISKVFSNFDKLHPGEFQRTKFRVPKVGLQSNILMQAGKVNLRHGEELKRVELECLDPNTSTFDLFIKHLKLTADTPFVATGFQTLKSAETVWSRVRFMLAQCAADGVILPKMFREMHKKSFPGIIPEPVFVCSTTRPGGIELEMDSFGLSGNPSMAVFKNIGSWMKD